ncbi:MAG: hypothetical protein AAGA55_02295 [Planctomycetota bacterium]
MRSRRRLTLAASCWAAVAAAAAVQLQADPISYQGRINESGVAADGTYDIRFQVFDASAGGSAIGVAVERTAVLSAEDGGLFSFDDLDFGDGVFTGEDRWIEVGVRVSGGGAFTTLAPRQPVRATPYAQYAQDAGVSLDDAFRNGATIFNDGPNPVVFRGLTQFGAASQANGFLQMFMIDSPSSILQFGSVPGLGGQTRWFDELGATIALLQADLEGSGVSLRLVGDGGVMEWDGDLGGSGPGGSRLFLTGPESGFSFSTGLTGDAALELPADAVSSVEIFDEAGLASDAANAGTTLNNSMQPILSRSITVPGPGYVIVLANGAISVQRLSNANGLMTIGVSDTPNSLPSTQQNVLQIPPIGVTGFYNWPASAHGVFEVPTDGTFTFYFNGTASGFGQPRIFDPNLTLLYIPTSYGDVTPTLIAPDGGYSSDAPIRGPLTDAEVLREQLREQARAIEQMRAMQESMRLQLEALRALSDPDPQSEPAPEHR